MIDKLLFYVLWQIPWTSRKWNQKRPKEALILFMALSQTRDLSKNH